jgi:hypothetical protein
MKLVKQIKIKPNFLKLKFRSLRYMIGLSNLKAWDNPPLAPPHL